MRPFLRIPTLVLGLLELTIEALAIYLSLLLNTWYFYFIAVVMIGTRLHAQAILMHEAVHYNLFPSKPFLNDLFANVLFGIPTLISVKSYRKLHLLHHQDPGGKSDPERNILYYHSTWEYKPLTKIRFAKLIIFDFLQVSTIKLIMGALKYRPSLIIQNKKSGQELLFQYLSISTISIVILSITLTLLLLLGFYTTLFIILLWLLALFFVFHPLNRIRSYCEHKLEDKSVISNNWNVSLIGLLTIWPYRINLHGIHHNSPSIPWYKMKSNTGKIAPKSYKKNLVI